MKPKTSFDATWPFIDLENYIYLNTSLTRKECRSIASDCWRRGFTKEQALNIAKEKQAD